ncbi:MAG: hypothetical protein U1A23_01330 [Candidatus Sungbacteria bacterium]|nr:hypothetical protein [Candidatus Sungbacteria bacterium]
MLMESVNGKMTLADQPKGMGREWGHRKWGQQEMGTGKWGQGQ